MTIATPEIKFTFPFYVYKPVIGKTRLLLFEGKEGVGKSTLACATAYYLSMLGYKTLLLTADPAEHIGIILGSEITHQVEPLVAVPNLWTACIDSKEATGKSKEKALSDAKTRLAENNLAAIEAEQEPLCTEVMAVFDQFADCTIGSDFDVIVFDTDGTDLTQRLLVFSNQIEKITDSEKSICFIEHTRKRFDLARKFMDPEATLFTLVVSPETTSATEAHRSFLDLQKAGIRVDLVIANQLLSPDQKADNSYRIRVEIQRQYLADIAERFPCPVAAMPLFSGEIIGLEPLRQAAELFFAWGAEKLRTT